MEYVCGLCVSLSCTLSYLTNASVLQPVHLLMITCLGHLLGTRLRISSSETSALSPRSRSRMEYVVFCVIPCVQPGSPMRCLARMMLIRTTRAMKDIETRNGGWTGRCMKENATTLACVELNQCRCRFRLTISDLVLHPSFQ